MNTSGPNPWCWAHNDRIGPDVVTFGVNLSQKNQNKHDNIWPHKTTPKMTTSGPNPGSGAPKTQVLGPMWLSFLVVLDGLTLTLIGFLRFLGPPGPKEAKMGSLLCS